MKQQRTEKEREQLVLRICSGEPLDDIAADLGCTRGNVYNFTRSQWFVRIKKYLTERGEINEQRNN